jgi:hypothetical protein
MSADGRRSEVTAHGQATLLTDPFRVQGVPCGGTVEPDSRYRRKRASMRKVIEGLDDKQRAALGEWADFGTAVFSSALAVAVLKSIVDLFT